VKLTNGLRRESEWEISAEGDAFHPEMAVHGKFGQPCRWLAARQ